MAYDAVKMPDWQISEEAEKNMPTPEEWQEKLGLKKEEVLPMGRLAKLDFLKIINRLQNTLRSPPSHRPHWVRGKAPLLVGLWKVWGNAV